VGSLSLARHEAEAEPHRPIDEPAFGRPHENLRRMERRFDLGSYGCDDGDRARAVGDVVLQDERGAGPGALGQLFAKRSPSLAFVAHPPRGRISCTLSLNRPP